MNCLNFTNLVLKSPSFCGNGFKYSKMSHFRSQQTILINENRIVFVLTDQTGWCELSENCCGKRQSPIDLKFAGAEVDEPAFVLLEYSDLPSSVKMVNDGHSVILTFQGVKPTMSGGGHSTEYFLEFMVFHWGDDDSKGSEHSIHGDFWPLELQLVHYSSKYESVAAAIGSGESDAVAAFAVFFVISEEKDSNPSLEAITSALPKIKYCQESTEVTPFDIRRLMPSTDKFFRYAGSLTVPGCQEVVLWTIFIKLSRVTPSQMEAFRSVLGLEDKSMANNVRETQADLSFHIGQY